MGRYVAAALLASALWLTLPATHAAATTIDHKTNQSLDSSGNSGRTFRDGIASSCATVKSPAPQTLDPLSPYARRFFQYEVVINEPLCVTVIVSTQCAGENEIMSVSRYIPAPLANSVYAGDMGNSPNNPSSPGNTREYSFAVPGGTYFLSTVVEATVFQKTCSPYEIRIVADRAWAAKRPTIAGVPMVGANLTATDAEWTDSWPSTRQWRRCDAAGGACADIPGADAATYTLTNADIGHAIRLRGIAVDGTAISTTDSTSTVGVFIPIERRLAEDLSSGDRVQQGLLEPNNVESRCGAPKPPPITITAVGGRYDAFSTTSLVNEPVCISTVSTGGAGAACASGALPAAYMPAYAPGTSLQANYAGDSGQGQGNQKSFSYVLPGGATTETVVTTGFNATPPSCALYRIEVGADAPFATGRPVLTGTAVSGGSLTATDGIWTGSPALARSWLRCDAAGSACVAIAGADGATYSPSGADGGHRLRARITATQGQAVSADSAPSEVVPGTPGAGAAPGGATGPGGGAGPGGGGSPLLADTTAPRATLKISGGDLAKLVKQGSIPVTVKPDEDCSIVLEARITARLAKGLHLTRTVRIARGKGAGKVGRNGVVRARLTRRARKALRGRKSLRIQVVATLKDTSGNARGVSAKRTLKRKR